MKRLRIIIDTIIQSKQPFMLLLSLVVISNSSCMKKRLAKLPQPHVTAQAPLQLPTPLVSTQPPAQPTSTATPQVQPLPAPQTLTNAAPAVTPSPTPPPPQVQPATVTPATGPTSAQAPQSTGVPTIQLTPPTLTTTTSTTRQGTLRPEELDFEVQNTIGKTVWVTYFSYIKKHEFARWRWDKSPVYKVDDNQSVVIDIDTVKDEQERKNIFGYLAVFNSEKDAQDATFELINENNLVDLDQLIHLQGKKVTLTIEKYGMRGEFLEYDFIKKKSNDASKPAELDFLVENQTGKSILVTAFIYQKKAKGTWLAEKTKESWTATEEARDDMSVWRFDKTPILQLDPGHVGMIDVDTIIEPRDRSFVRGYLAIFDIDERKEAEAAVYELLPSYRKLHLGNLQNNLRNKKVVIEVEKYGPSENDFIDYTLKPTRKIDFTKIIK